MKRIFYLMLLVLVAFSCTKPKGVDVLIGDPTERVADTLAYLKKTLVDAPDGWKAYLSTAYSGGYGFYMKFDQDDRMKMIADLTDESSSVVKESTYRIRQIMNATLSFDTYNYITMLEDPNPDAYGGQAGKGMGSDVEFDYIKTVGDSLFFEGRKFKKALVLVKASNTESKEYLNKGYSNAIKATNEFFTNNQNSYIEVDGLKYQISINSGTKEVGAMTILPGNKVVSTTTNFYYTLDGFGCAMDSLANFGKANVISKLKVGKINIVKIANEGGKYFAIDENNKKYEIKNSIQPLVPLHLLIGSKYVGVYLDYKVLLPGTSADGTTIINRYFNGLANGTPYYFNCGYFSLQWDKNNNRINLVGFTSQSNCNSGWNTTIGYNYTLDEETGIFKLTKRSEATGGYAANILDQLDDFLINSSFKLEYYVDGSNVYGKMIGIERPNVQMTFDLF
ncbi:MAG: DUF4302 domain-containing protein [Sphingobacterium sp.]